MFILETKLEITVFQCQNCRCIPDYCPQTVPRSLCPCDGIQAACSHTTADMQAVITNARNVQQQQLVIPQTPAVKYFLIQQPIQSVPVQIPSQIVVENQQQQQQQLVQTLASLQQQILSQQIRVSGIQHPSTSPVYVIRTIEQPGQVLRQVQQISEPAIPSQYVPAIPIQQTQMIFVPSVQQLIPQTQSFILPLQIPLQTVTLQVPGNFNSDLNINNRLFSKKNCI